MENSENKKRARDPESGGSDADSPESKLTRVDSNNSTDNTCESGVTPVDSVSKSLDPGHVKFDLGESGLDSPGARLIQDDLLNIFEDSENVADTDCDPAIQGLDWVIRSFEEEIHMPAATPAVTRMTSDSGESQPELGYLLEASDDELGLPPTTGTGDDVRIEACDFEKTCSEAVGMDGMLGFEDEVPSYDSYVFGVGGGTNCNDSNGIDEYVTLGGLFDYCDASYENGAVSEVAWRSESLPAL